MISERNVKIRAFATEKRMGAAVAKDVGKILRTYTTKKGLPVVGNFAAAPSQDAFLDRLCKAKGCDWSKLLAVHLDEYFDLPKGHCNTFQAYLDEHLFGKVPVPRENIRYIKDVEGASVEDVAEKYERIMRDTIADVRGKGGVYIACIGIGVNGHIAFNEPHVDKRTSRMVIPVEIDDVSVRQQYDDYKNHPNPSARYASLADVPRRAVTVSCAGILDAEMIFCTVPGAHKAAAVKAMCDGPISDAVPASLLRMHPNVTIYLDEASASQLDEIPRIVHR